jgi:hypothetical protein
MKNDEWKMDTSIFDQIRRDRHLGTGFSRQLQQKVQILGLFLIQVDELNSKAKPVMVMANLALQIEPISLRKQHAKSHNFARHDFAYRVEITTAFREIGYARRVAFLATVPNRIEAHAQTGFRSSFIHAPSIIEFFDEVEKEKSNPWIRF